MRISDWSSDVCSSDLDTFKLLARRPINTPVPAPQENMLKHGIDRLAAGAQLASNPFRQLRAIHPLHAVISKMDQDLHTMPSCCPTGKVITGYLASLDTELLGQIREAIRSEEHTSELQSLMRISYAVFCLKKKKKKSKTYHITLPTKMMSNIMNRQYAT